MRRITGGRYDLVEGLRSSGATAPQTVSYLTTRYFEFRRELAYPETTDGGTWQDWRAELRGRLRLVLRLDELGPVPTPRPQLLHTVEHAAYLQQHLAYETLPGNWVTAYLLLPRGGPARKAAVLCPHGHVPPVGKEAVVNPDVPGLLGVPYGRELAVRGLVVLAPDNAGMGERDVSADTLSRGKSCLAVWVRLNHMGLDLTGFRVFELLAGLNLLASLNEVDAARLGCAGLSGGCWLAQVVAALDERIRAVILSSLFTTFVQTIWHGHCICHHPFGIGQLCDLPDLSALIAPRPQFVESGVQDRACPFEPARSLVQRAYELLGVPDQFQSDRHEGGHLFRGTKSIPWLVHHLSEEPA